MRWPIRCSALLQDLLSCQRSQHIHPGMTSTPYASALGVEVVAPRAYLRGESCSGPDPSREANSVFEASIRVAQQHVLRPSRRRRIMTRRPVEPKTRGHRTASSSKLTSRIPKRNGARKSEGCLENRSAPDSGHTGSRRPFARATTAAVFSIAKRGKNRSASNATAFVSFGPSVTSLADREPFCLVGPAFRRHNRGLRSLRGAVGPSCSKSSALIVKSA